MERTGGTYSRHAHGGNCMICGNVFATYTVLFYHKLTNTYVRAGQDCAQKLEMSDDGAFNYFTAGVRDARMAQAGKRKAQATLEDLGLSAAWALASYVGEHRDEQTVRDIVGKLVQYGSLSEKQVAFLRVLLDRIARRPEIEAERAARDAARADCPTGRLLIEGVILSTKTQDSDFSRFGVLKMLVEHATGFKVWGTVPQSLFTRPDGSAYELKGSRVAFTATVKPSDKDPKFGFFSRPTGARLLEAKEIAK